MFVPGLVEIACSLACRFMFGLQNGYPKMLHFIIPFLNMIKDTSALASAKSFSLTFAGAGRTHSLSVFKRNVVDFLHSVGRFTKSC